MENEPKVDITGMLHDRNENWEERVRELCKPENFSVSIVHFGLEQHITGDELERLNRKLEMVQMYAAVMAAGMLKGTLKYPEDNLPLEDWFASLIGEGADKANYDLLTADAYHAIR